MNKNLWFISRRVLLYHIEHGSIIVCQNWRKKLGTIEEENFDREKQDIEFEDISNLKENLNSSVEMLGCLLVKSVGSRDKIGYGKRKMAEVCDVTKGETWKIIEKLGLIQAVFDIGISILGTVIWTCPISVPKIDISMSKTGLLTVKQPLNPILVFRSTLQ